MKKITIKNNLKLATDVDTGERDVVSSDGICFRASIHDGTIVLQGGTVEICYHAEEVKIIVRDKCGDEDES